MSFVARTKGGTVTTWNIPARSPITQEMITDIEWLQADGDELDYIRSIYAVHYDQQCRPEREYSIPMPRGPIARWYGDMAKTILFSL